MLETSMFDVDPDWQYAVPNPMWLPRESGKRVITLIPNEGSERHEVTSDQVGTYIEHFLKFPPPIQQCGWLFYSVPYFHQTTNVLMFSSVISLF